MKKEDVLNLMSAVPADLIEEADIQAPNQRRFPKAVRAGLIAACLCAALLGTAFAAANPEIVADFLSRFTSVQAEPYTMPDGTDGYYVSYEQPDGYPIDSFSPALLAAGEGRGDDSIIQLTFDTWEEVRAFIGEDIPCFLPETVESQSSQFEVTLDYSADKLHCVDVFTGGTAPWVLMSIPTEYNSGDATGTSGGVMTFESESDYHLELLSPYSMANGCQAEIALFTFSADSENPDAVDWVFCIASFVQDGILYRVQGGGNCPEEQWLSQLYDTLDLFP